MKKYLDSKRKANNHLIIGDFNIDLLKQDKVELKHLNSLLEGEFRPGFQTITRPSTNDNSMGSCIDNIFIKSKSFKDKSFKYENLFNDHYPLFLNIEKINYQKTKESYHYINYNKLNRIAVKIDWSSILSLQNPNDATDLLINKIDSCVQKAKRLSKRKTKKCNEIPRSNWITKSIIISCKRKEMLYNVLKLEPNNESLKIEYKNYSKILGRVIKQAKNMYEKREIEKFAGDQKRLWEIVNRKLGNNNKKVDYIRYIKNESKQKIHDSMEIADKMNNFFCNIGTDLCKQIAQPLNAHVKPPPFNPDTIYLQPTNPIEIHRIINNLKLKKGGLIILMQKRSYL